VYFYKDGVNDKIHAGPAWDFDRIFNGGAVAVDSDLTKRVDANEYFSPEDQYWQWSKLYSRLIEFPEFEAAVRQIYFSRVAGHKEDFLQYIAGQAERIEKAAEKDGKRWNKENFSQEIDVMLDWINGRYAYLENEFGVVGQRKK
ncbi:MAG: CotH kinase family protein, partial [Candidatus Saccharimonadaceae bacterium]|nr:CotH kinase family protein [Candidatus Saccharimonadaceae bacterium]